MNKLPHITVFDSGAGGLSIAKTILRKPPSSLRLSYFADRSAFPYGNKNEPFLIAHVCKLIGDFIHQHQPDLIVIACNTASTIVLPELRRLFTCPIVGVVPAIKPAAQLSVSKSIGILATPATVTREYTATLINEFAPNCRVSLYGSDKLVRCAEDFITSKKLDLQTIDEELGALLNQHKDIDTVVLACTHFPLIREALKNSAKGIIHWVDSNDAVARRAFHLMAEHFQHEQYTPANNELDIYFSTDKLDDIEIEKLRDSYTKYLESD